MGELNSRRREHFGRESMALQQSVSGATCSAARLLQKLFIDIPYVADKNVSLIVARARLIDSANPWSFSSHSAGCVPWWEVGRVGMDCGSALID